MGVGLGPEPSQGTVRIGVLGGTFDPVHAGHVARAEDARRALRLDRVVFVVAGDPWMKTSSGRRVTSGHHRAEMVRLALRGRPGLVPDGREIDRQVPSRTADTLEELASEHPSARLYLLIGADCLATLADWSRPARILELAAVVVLTRPGSEADLGRLDEIVPGAAARARVLGGRQVPLSSSAIRARLAGGLATTGALDEAVASYAERNRLYRRG